MERARRFLVVVRAGELSLHKNWLAGAPRNWDLVVSWFGDVPYEPVSDELVLNIKGGAGDGLYKTFEANPELLETYDFFWLPDDDIETDAATINRLFQIAAEEDLPVCQPALSHNSYFSHMHTLASPSCKLRYTSFVEIMVPCLSRAKLNAVLPFFAENPSSYGLDRIWTRLEASNGYRAAIIDETPVRHTRPVGTYLHPRMRMRGQDRDEDCRRVVAQFGLAGNDKGFKCYAGLSRNKGIRYSALVTRLMMAWDYCRNAPHRIQPIKLKKGVTHFMRPNASLSQITRTISSIADPRQFPAQAGK